jgi:purine-binding chemotaxis protein CheW
MSKKSVPKITFDASAKMKKFVIFELHDNKFAVPVEQISQITKFDKAFPLPNAPEYVLGVINLRGRIISLIDLERRLGLTSSSVETNETKQILFVDLGFETVGMLIDKVVNLASISSDEVNDNIDLISGQISMEYLKGAALHEEDIIVILNLDMILSEYEIQEIIDSKDKLKLALETKEKIEISEEELVELNLGDDDFNILN